VVKRPPSKAASRASGVGVSKRNPVVAQSLIGEPPPLVSLRTTRPYTGVGPLFSITFVNNPG
jgi:hypothetical protein